MLFHNYVAESLWRDQQQALEKRIRRGDFIDHKIVADTPKVSTIRKWLSSRKKKRVNPQV
ncbi:hypothetical protein [Bacillus sp. FJAT-28004]|uniref:hypothetical protein n=1 Tax=Bacillus sp. FJAT-28004 TaxID=1679165 RepID=UPI0006B65385|nr:hypothetical protein [Bacillus sp. FJAT-28004]